MERLALELDDLELFMQFGTRFKGPPYDPKTNTYLPKWPAGRKKLKSMSPEQQELVQDGLKEFLKYWSPRGFDYVRYRHEYLYDKPEEGAWKL